MFMKSKLLIFAAFAIASFFLGAPQSAQATLDLEVPLEMVDYGLQSQTSTTTFARTGMYLDASDYDGATFYFEIVGETVATDWSLVTLRDVTNGVDKVSITPVPSQANVPKRWRSASWTPASGKIEYRIKMGFTDITGDYIVHSARIVIEQHNATKTRIQIPLVQRAFNASAGVAGNVDTTTSTTYTQADPDRYSLWNKNTGVYADLCSISCGGTPWTLEAVLSLATSSPPNDYAHAALFNSTTGSQVTGTDISVMDTTEATLADVSFSNAAANFTEGDNFDVKIKMTGSNTGAELRSAARLYVKLENLRKAEILYRVGRVRGGTAGVAMPYQRVLLDKTKFSNPAIFFEASGQCIQSTTHVSLRNHGTNDSGTNGSNVTGSGLNFYVGSATKVIERSGDITANITSGNRFYAQTNSTSSTLTLNHAWLVVQATEQIFHRWDGYLKFFGTLKFL